MRKNKSILKTQRRFRRERHNIFTEEINKFALSWNDDKRIRSDDSIETYAYGMGKKKRSKKEEDKCHNIITIKKWLTLMMS